MRRRAILVGSAAIALAAPASACKGKGDAAGDEAGGDSVAAVVTAQTAVAQVRELAVMVGALGTVSAAPGRMAQLAAPAPSRVVRIFAATGQRVAAGQPLVALDATSWEADVRKAQAERAAAQRDYDRTSRLAQAGILPRKDAETAAAALATASAALSQASHVRAQAVLRSPIAGVVSRVNATLQAPADPAQALVEVVDPAGLEVSLSLSPEQAAGVRVGQAVQVTSGRDGGGTLLGTGVVAGIGAAIDTTSGSVQVRATLTHPAGNLFVGQDVYGTVEVARRPAAVTVPPEAIVPGDDGTQVFVVDAKGVAHATAVTVGARHPDAVEVTAGLRGGETVVAKGAYGVQDGARIRRGTP
ncbi:MAG TPA: efflux RND transporter periplasmic adaptor subunit [Longimicrobiaceae bacterium]|nr:efflux RND transporter periplasmic adaptor subunit [Longimicrobiaceae bacterium]